MDDTNTDSDDVSDVFPDDELEEKQTDQVAALDTPDVDNTEENPFPDDPDTIDGPVEFAPPNLKTARFGLFGEIWALRKHIKKRRKMIKKGYVEWYLIDGSFPRPRYVKPEPEGGGIPEYEYDDDPYLFPHGARIANEQNGGWVYVHYKGDAEPINLREPKEHGIPVDLLEEYKQLIVTSSPPSLLDKLDISGKDAFMYMIAAIVGFAFLQGAMGGF